MTEPARLLRRMVDALIATGELIPEWVEAFRSVPRHAFIPDTIWRYRGDELVPLRRGDDPDQWLEFAYGPDHVITQVDDGSPSGPGLVGRQATSSAPRPDIIALMLAALAVESGMTVCEIGTGTGYNAALLAERLGPDKVTTIEADPQVAGQARLALAKTGHHEVKVITGDGAQGYPPRAPYDRVLATVAAPLVPYEWVAQTRPGGRVVTPWATRYYSAGLLSLTVGDDGTAVGGLVNNTVSFMWLRDQRVQRVGSVREFVYNEDTATESRTDLHPADVLNDEDAACTIGLRVPDCEYVYRPAGDGSGKYTVWFLDPVSRSWAAINYEPGVDTYHVSQLGPRNLWDEVEAAYRWWVDAGRPKTGQWRFTVTRKGQHIELTS